MICSCNGRNDSKPKYCLRAARKSICAQLNHFDPDLEETDQVVLASSLPIWKPPIDSRIIFSGDFAVANSALHFLHVPPAFAMKGGALRPSPFVANGATVPS